jgi:DtxR family Mn-dependent transcriptional regulator
VNNVTLQNRRFRFRGGRKADALSAEPFHYHKEDADELLELAYTLKESGGLITIEELKEKYEEDVDIDRLLSEMTSTGLLKISDDVVAFSEEGISEAERLIRAHRLAERLLIDVLLVNKDQDLESQACAMEHVLNPGVVDNICTILNHPKACPHGHEIPPGPCCKDKARTASPAIHSLDQLRSGESGRILYVETTDHARLDRLTSFGMLPGTVVRVHQRQPSLVVILGETQLALDREIAQHIHLVKTG